MVVPHSIGARISPKFCAPTLPLPLTGANISRYCNDDDGDGNDPKYRVVGEGDGNDPKYLTLGRGDIFAAEFNCLTFLVGVPVIEFFERSIEKKNFECN